MVTEEDLLLVVSTYADYPKWHSHLLSYLRQNSFQQQCCLIQFLHLDNHIPKRFKLLPTTRVEKMFQLMFQAAMKQATAIALQL